MTPNDREQKVTALIDKLCLTHKLRRSEWVTLIRERTPAAAEHLFELARAVRIHHYGHDIYIRGLIEFTNYCRNDCYYCGIRKSNANALRYRLSKEDILTCCKEGYRLGFRTFVLQGGEDGWFTDERLCDIVSAIRAQFPDCAITLSVGERSYDSYKRLYDAGADRYLLRHETYDEKHYSRLHPPQLSATHRKQCLWNLKKIGYQVGTGFMVGSPYQTPENLADDMLFLAKLNPQMVGIGPFIPHPQTSLKDHPAGSSRMTVRAVAAARLLLPSANLPATTALEVLDSTERRHVFSCGANVIMKKVTPPEFQQLYDIYPSDKPLELDIPKDRIKLEEQLRSLGLTPC